MVHTILDEGRKTQHPYGMADSMAEPMAEIWATQTGLLASTLRIDPEFIKQTDDPSHPFYLPDRPLPGSTQEQDEIDELLELEQLRDNPLLLEESRVGRERCRISTFLLLRPEPYGAVIGPQRSPNEPLIRTGRELAHYFEYETPGLAHRQALNFLVRLSPWSPVKQARIWMALDTAIYTAAMAAWHYKWLSKRGASVTHRPRPSELAPQLRALYKFTNGNAHLDKNPTQPASLTKHPSYPSAHSTIASAASTILTHFFPAYRSDLDDLADNVGMARLWAGVSYRSDHISGIHLGRAVGQRIIEHLTSG